MTKETAETAQSSSKAESYNEGERGLEDRGEATAAKLKEVNVGRLSDQLAALMNWRVKLVRMLLTREMSPDLFSEIYLEYLKKARELDRKRIELSKTISKRIESLSFELQQLKLRCEAGELSAKEYIERKLKVDQEMWALGPKLNVLQNPRKTTGLSFSGIYGGLLELAEDFEREAPMLGLSVRTVNNVLRDLKRIHAVLSAESQG